MAKLSALDEFKKKVVEVALKAANENDWCEEVDDLLRDQLGLGALLPPTYRIETLQSKRHRKWNRYTTTYRDLDEAKIQAQKTFDNDRRPWNYYYGDSRYIGETIDATTDIDKFVKKIKSDHAALVEQAEKRKSSSQEEFPKYRVVRADTGETMYEAAYAK